MRSPRTPDVPFVYAALPIAVLLAMVLYGLVLRPLALDQTALPIEIVFIAAAAFAIAELVLLGFGWPELERSIIDRLKRALPAFFILLSIGLVIGSWMICGTIPMMVYYGLQWIEPSLLYLFAFLVPVVFSVLTGTSWGSAGAIGIVIMGISQALGGHLGITAGAVIGGAFFGDKMSPLSDTTNLAALAAEVDLYEHVRSMAMTTLPSALIAAAAYAALGLVYPPTRLASDVAGSEAFLGALEATFDFNVLLLLPPAIVLGASLRRKPPVPTLGVSVATATALALGFQRFTLADVATCLRDGFRLDRAPWVTEVPPEVVVLLERGGLFALVDAIVLGFSVFVFIGTLDHIDAMPRVIGRLFRFAKRRSTTILSSLAATALTSALTSHQYATSFIVGDAFKSRYDAMRIPRKVLSRSLEDAGTMLESLVPWTPTSVFMVTTLGVAYGDYWHWQLLSLINLVVAPVLAILGIGCFYDEQDRMAGTSSRRNSSTEP